MEKESSATLAQGEWRAMTMKGAGSKWEKKDMG
jgi:hypothetical protein